MQNTKSDIKLMKQCLKNPEDKKLIKILIKKSLLKENEPINHLEYKIDILESLEYLKAGAYVACKTV